MTDTEELARRLQDRLGALLHKPVEVEHLAPLAGGACQLNYRARISVDGRARDLALRSDARGALPGSLRRDAEFAVMRAAAKADVPTPEPRWLLPDLLRPDSWAYFTDWLEGEALGGRVTRSPALSDARDVLPKQLAVALAAIHAITPQTHPDLPLHRWPFPQEGDPFEVGLSFLRATLDDLPAPRPACELILRWLSENRPTTEERALVHGDFRTGNFMVGAEVGLVAILDWEFAHWGDPMEDLGWLCVRDWRFGQVTLPAGGLTTRERMHHAYRNATGRQVDPARAHWWEVFGNLKWGVATALQGRRYFAGESDIELLAIPRRAIEMEYEALRLIGEKV